MQLTKKDLYSEEELTEMEICSFVNEGRKSAYREELLDVDEVFDELEKSLNH